MAPRPAGDTEGISRTEFMRASPRMFKSDLLDKFSRVHPAVPPILFGPVIIVGYVLGFVHGAGLDALWLIPGGYLLWTLSEYWIHRIVFHWEPERGIGARFHYIAHGVHHDHPNDPMRLVMPPSVSVPLATVFVFVFYLVLGSPDFFIFGASFLLGYLVYDMTHYYLHHFKPRTALGRRLRELHMRHHFQDDTIAYGISAPYWDMIFGTSAANRDKAKPQKPADDLAGAAR
jgi:sterol desaturase/sphingolipid hydroxylase (fatty acid hydroxylase superfamily)